MKRRHYVYVYYDSRPNKGGAAIYVGKGTVGTNRHRSHLRHTHNTVLRNVLGKIAKSGLKPRIKIEARFEREEDAFEYEIILIKHFGRRITKTGTLCNISDGGEGVSSGVTNPNKDGHTFRGRRHSYKSRSRMSRKHRGKTLSEEHKRNIGKASAGENNPMYGMSGELSPAFGRKHTKSELRKMSEALMGENNPMFGKKHSDEARAKMSKARKGRRFSQEHRDKISAALTASWARRKAATCQ